MWKIFESDKVIMYLVIVVLIALGVFVNKLFLHQLDFGAFIAGLANLATIAVAGFAFWEYKKWKLSANNVETHKLILDFATNLQSYDLVIPRVLSPSSRSQFIEDYNSWSNIYLELMQFQSRYNFLTNQDYRHFSQLGFTELAKLEGKLVKLNSIKLLACRDFNVAPSDGANLLYDFLEGKVTKDGKFNVYHLSWTSELTYQNLELANAIRELKAKVHS